MIAVTEIERVVVLTEHEAELLVHVLAAFERLLRQGELGRAQFRWLVPDGLSVPGERADVEMAEVVVEAGEPLRRQL
jgi:hypothetical protein